MARPCSTIPPTNCICRSGAMCVSTRCCGCAGWRSSARPPPCWWSITARVPAADLGLPRGDRAVGLAQRRAAGALQPDAAARARARGLAARLRHRRARGAAVPDRRPGESVRVPVPRRRCCCRRPRCRRASRSCSARSRWSAPPCWCSRIIRCRGTPTIRSNCRGSICSASGSRSCSAIGFIGVYAWQITEEGRQLAEALAATELVLAREQHLSQLDGLAAAAAHELGTPLSTISVVAKELERALEPNSPHADDVRLLREQSQRCRDILAKLTELSTGEPFDRAAAVGADRGGGGAAPQLRRRHRRRACRTIRAADGRAQPGHPLRPRQPAGERGRFRPDAASRSPRTGATRTSPSPSATTGRALRPRSWTGSASPMCDRASAAA